MKNVQKKWLTAALLLIVAGLLLFAAALAAAGLDITKLDTQNYRQTDHRISGSFDSICADVDTAQISFAPYEGEGCLVTCFEAEAAPHSVEIEDGCLKITVHDRRRWYDHIGVSFASPKITVCLPESSYSSLTVKTATGDVSVSEDLCFDSIDIAGSTADIDCQASARESVKIRTTTGHISLGTQNTKTVGLSATTGSISLQDVLCKTLTLHSSTGRIRLTDVIAEDRMHAENTTGGIHFLRCDAGEMYAKTSTGDITGSLLSEKAFSTKTSTGTVQVDSSVPQANGEIIDSSGNVVVSRKSAGKTDPASLPALGGKCELITSTGDIRILIS